MQARLYSFMEKAIIHEIVTADGLIPRGQSQTSFR